MVPVLQGVQEKIVSAILATTAVFGGLFAMMQPAVAPHATQVQNAQTAAVYQVITMPSSTAPVTPVNDATITPNLLPVVTLSSHKIGSTAATITAANIKAVAQVPAAATAATAAQAVTVTAQWLLDNTKLSFKQERDGTYEGVFSADAGTQALTWGTADTSVGGSNGIPKFAFTFSCNPLLETPTSVSLEQVPYFTVRTSYNCTIGFKAMSGTDQQSLTKNINVTTGAGQFIVTPPSSMDTVLAYNTNQGGFVFTNQDTNPITVTGLTLDISYTALNTSGGPLVLRILDQASGATLFDYHMEKIPTDPSIPYTNTATGVQVPITFTVGAANQKLLPVELLGVDTMSISGVNPTMTLTLRAIESNASSDVPVVLNGAQIQWSCIVALTAYDPNATSGPQASGMACQ